MRQRWSEYLHIASKCALAPNVFKIIVIQLLLKCKIRHEAWMPRIVLEYGTCKPTSHNEVIFFFFV